MSNATAMGDTAESSWSDARNSVGTGDAAGPGSSNVANGAGTGAGRIGNMDSVKAGQLVNY